MQPIFWLAALIVFGVGEAVTVGLTSIWFALGSLGALIVSGLSHQTGELGRFIDLVRESGADLPLRAMVTPTSKNWTLAQLLQELNREHEAVGEGGQA